VQVLEDTANVKLLQLVVQNADHATKHNQRRERRHPTQGAPILGRRLRPGIRLTSQD
jgi:hypothetical protein